MGVKHRFTSGVGRFKVVIKKIRMTSSLDAVAHQQPIITYDRKITFSEITDGDGISILLRAMQLFRTFWDVVKLKLNRSNGSTLKCLRFFNFNDIVYFEFLPQNQMSNKGIKKKCPDL